MSQDQRTFICDFFRENSSERGCYVMKAIHDASSIPAAKLLLDPSVNQRMVSLAAEYEDLLALQSRSKDYGDFKKYMKKFNKNARDMEERATNVAQATGRILVDRCNEVSALISSYGLHVPRVIECGSMYLNPYQSRDYYLNYPKRLTSSITYVWKMRRLYEIYLANMRRVISYFGSGLGHDSDLRELGEDISGMFRFVNEVLLSDQSLNYLKSVRDGLTRLADYALRIQMLTSPRGDYEVEQLRVYDEEGGGIENWANVVKAARANPDEFLALLLRYSSRSGTVITEEFYRRNRLGDSIDALGDDLSRMLAEYAAAAKIPQGGTAYLGDPLFTPFFVLSSRSECDDCEVIAEHVAGMDLKDRFDALSGVKFIKPLAIDITMSPSWIRRTLVDGGSRVARYMDVRTHSRTMSEALANLRSYWYAKEILMRLASGIAYELKSTMYSQEFLALFSDKFNAVKLKEILDGIGSSWEGLGEALRLALGELDMLSLGIDEALESGLANVIDGKGAEGAESLSFDDIKRMKLTGAKILRTAKDGPFIVYVTEGGRVRVAPSLSWFYEAFSRKTSVDSLVDEVKKAWGLADKETAMNYVEVFVNGLIRAGLVKYGEVVGERREEKTPGRN
ncbi:MAG: hypothetical protein ACP5UD_07585 [Conexivisphaera sp.]